MAVLLRLVCYITVIYRNVPSGPNASSSDICIIPNRQKFYKPQQPSHKFCEVFRLQAWNTPGLLEFTDTIYMYSLPCSLFHQRCMSEWRVSLEPLLNQRFFQVPPARMSASSIKWVVRRISLIVLHSVKKLQSRHYEYGSITTVGSFGNASCNQLKCRYCKIFK